MISAGKIDFSFLHTLKKFFNGPYIFEVEFENHYEDFQKNLKTFMSLMEG